MSDEIQHEARVAESKQYHSKKRGRPKKEQPEKTNLKSWHERVGDKVVKKTETESGCRYSEYVGKFKDFKHLVK